VSKGQEVRHRKGDGVLVAFEAGEVRKPYVIGLLWNGKDVPPEQ
jgi:uncharacterized protein involved in type VI secretion and phage assembly